LVTHQLGRQRCRAEPEALAALVHYNWPGNVRELVNVLERAQILAEDHLITIDDLPENLLVDMPATVAAGPTAAAAAPAANPTALREVERQHVREVLQQAGSNKVQAAKLLGVSRRALYRLIAKYKLDDAEPLPLPS
jgi:DNA-binding NtrC family response regulator